MHINYFSQNNIQLSKKKKVYFTCHPDDFEVCSKSISNDLFTHCDCAIYYYNPTDNIDQSVKTFDFSQMSLFVFAVTKKFLTEPNSALDFDLDYAVKKHIPILPIIVESGIEGLALEKFGSMQFMDKVALSPDAYDDKLDTFLRGIMENENLEKRLDKVFHGHAFISYRKKDRKAAISVMKTLHYRSINAFLGMWYDEFLTPGEDFNENIAEGIQNCDIFVMVITPHIVEDENYVLNNEYPLAKKLNKHIIPIVVAHVDGALLRKKFPELPPCISIRDHKRIAEEVNKGLSHLPPRKSSLEDFYYMGLAFLEGCGVEKNVQQGLDFIEFAAKKNRFLAQAKLVAMYRWGEGVEQDFAKALKWQQALVETREKFLKRAGDNSSERKAYYTALYTLSYLYQKNDIFTEAEATARKGISYAESIISQKKYENSFRDNKARFELLTHLMSVLYAAGKPEEAIELYESFIGDLEEKEEESVKYNNQLVATYNSMQGIYEKMGDHDGVRRMAEKSLEAISRGESGSYGRTNIPHAMAHNRKGTAYLEEENYHEAAKEYKAAVEIYESFKKLDDKRDVNNISGMTWDLAYAYKKLGRYEEAIRCYLKAIEYRGLFMDEPYQIRNMYSMLVNVADLYFETRKYAEAEKHYDRADAYFKNLCKLYPDDFKEENCGWYRKKAPLTEKKTVSSGQAPAGNMSFSDFIFLILKIIFSIIILGCQVLIYIAKAILSLFIK